MPGSGRISAVSLIMGVSTILTLAQTTTNISGDFAATGSISPTGHIGQNLLNVVLTGSAGALGLAALDVNTSAPTNSTGDTFSPPAQVSAALWFNAVDSIQISITVNDLSLFNQPTAVYPAGTITGGTGVWAGASGSITVTVVNIDQHNFTISGTGSVTVGGKTTPLNLTGFHGNDSTGNAPQRILTTIDYAGTLSPFGQVTANLSVYNTPVTASGTFTVFLNKTDSVVFGFIYGANIPSTLQLVIAGGTGAYTGATGSGTATLDLTADPPKIHASASVTTAAAGAPVITRVKTAFGRNEISGNTWLQINGTNLVPANTPATGVDWSNAPEFANGKMPTKLDGISVTVNGKPGFVYFFCSAATNPACKAGGDQINVLAPLLDPNNEVPIGVTVSNNGVSSAPFIVMRASLSPAFFLFDAVGHVVARHLDFSLMGPASLYPGSSTPAKAGETLILVGSGFGAPTGGGLVEGSSTQSGAISSALLCFVSGVQANVAAALISPGLYQLNVTVPAGTPSGDNPIACTYKGVPTAPGGLIAVQ